MQATPAKPVLKNGELFAYSFGLLGLQVVIGFMSSYQTEFYNKTMAADFAIIGILLLVAKVISCVADPYIGNLIDKSNLKGGKLRPWILISTIPFLVMSIVIFIVVPFRGVGLYIYIFITFLIWSIAMTLADIPSQGMLAMLTPRPDERNKAAGVANIFKSIGPAVPYVVIPIICIITGSEGGAINQLEYFVSALFLSILGCGLFLLIYFKNKERVPYKSSNSSMKEMMHILKNNKPLMLILISGLLGSGKAAGMGITIQTANAIVGDINILGMQLSGENTIIVLGVTSAVSSLVSMAIVPIMTKKWGEKKVFIGMALYGFVVTFAAFFLYFAGVRSLVSVLIMLFFVGLMWGYHQFLPMVMVADCVDYYEHKTGKRTEGVHYAVLSFSIKLSAAIGIGMGLVMVGLSGYSATSVSFSKQTQDIIYAAYLLLPGLGSLLCALPILKYTLVGKEKQRITEELAERRAQLALEQSGAEAGVNADANGEVSEKNEKSEE